MLTYCICAVTASLIATLVVFRNNISHARFNEARNHLTIAKNALRTVAGVMLSGGYNLHDGERYELFKSDAREVIRKLQVCVALPGTPDGVWGSRSVLAVCCDTQASHSATLSPHSCRVTVCCTLADCFVVVH